MCVCVCVCVFVCVCKTFSYKKNKTALIPSFILLLKTAPKTYWSMPKIFVNVSKIPLIPPPPLLVNNEFVTDFFVKANLFNEFFREQSRPISNCSSLPINQTIETLTRPSDITIVTDTTIKLIHSLNPNKAYGCDGISIRMLKLCATSILKPLNIFQMNGKKQILSQFIKKVTNR